MKTITKTREQELERDLRLAEGEIASLKEQLAQAEADAEEAQEALGEREGPEGAIHAFCDLVQRPVGRFEFVVPSGGQADRAILGLFDAIGRRP